MKKAMLLGCVIALLTASLCSAEKSLGLTLAQIEADRKNIVNEVVAPTEEQSEDFWKNYWQYRGGAKLLTDRTLEILKEFNDADFALSSSRSAALVLEVMDIEKKRVALKQSHVKEFQKILSPKQVARWYQTERKMDALIRADLAVTIPFNDLRADAGGELTEDVILDNREALVEAIVQLQKDQERPFRYEYRIYAKKLTKLYDRAAEVIEEFAANYGSISDEQATQMIKEAGEIDSDRVKALETLIYGLRFELTGTQMSRLMQGELKMKAILDLALASAIPIEG